MKLKKLFAAGIGVALALSLGSCDTSGPGGTSETPLIGISMPTTTLERWNSDGAHLKALMEAEGYKVDLQYADNKVDMQVSQIQNMINQNARVLVIAAIDGDSLTQVLKTAGEAGITVIAYDRLIKKTPYVDYYATFDNALVGQLQGEYIIEQLGLKSGATGPFNIEPFAGSPDDNNAGFFFAGAWDLLLPYVQSGVLVCPANKCPPSNEEWTTIGIMGWDSTTAQSEMENRLNSFYSGGVKPDVVLSPNDSLALGIAQALDGAGYQPGVDWPILTGQDGDVANLKNILAGKQSMVVWKDTRALGDQVAKMIKQILAGQTVDVNDTTTYNNDIKVVPSFLLPPKTITADTIQEMIDSGFVSAETLGL